MEENRRILIIDDDQGVRQTYVKILSAPGENQVLSQGRSLFGPSQETPSAAPYAVSLAEDGLTGIDMATRAVADQCPYAMAFIDMKMSGLNGAQTARRLWELDPDMKIVIVTAYSEHSPEDIVKTARRDDLFYLRKPFTPGEISQFARALVNAWNLEKKRAALEQDLQEVNARLEGMNQDLQDKVKAQTAIMVQSEKMAAVGLLAAGVAHEINNPISFVHANLEALENYIQKLGRFHVGLDTLAHRLTALNIPDNQPILEELDRLQHQEKIQMLLADLEDLVAETRDGIRRVRTIVSDLKTFSRKDDGVAAPARIHEILDTTLNMVKTQLRYKATVEKDYQEIPLIRCHGQKLGQVFMNLFINAAQAMDTPGTIRISTRQVAATDLSVGMGPHEALAYIEIVISDTGPGIAPEDMGHLFDPFFTTKPVGQGTGLGLSIVYEIVKLHGGHIQAANLPQGGACFTLLLPAIEEEGP